MAENNEYILFDELRELSGMSFALQKEVIDRVTCESRDIIINDVKSDRKIRDTLWRFLHYAWYGIPGTKERYMELVDYYSGIRPDDARNFRKYWEEDENENK